eukprot:TRINITY_DN82928_c0_g1_i1.p1 TRINITY_DN82928_c0_g1~~TRINITY_DN82928_c0_g1_i1.p1  ORF type:complete len:242 (+),score=43.49 TRINITY_DN82928_c0_g1_i1:102-827(+)
MACLCVPPAPKLRPSPSPPVSFEAIGYEVTLPPAHSGQEISEDGMMPPPLPVGRSTEGLQGADICGPLEAWVVTDAGAVKRRLAPPKAPRLRCQKAPRSIDELPVFMLPETLLSMQEEESEDDISDPHKDFQAECPEAPRLRPAQNEVFVPILSLPAVFGAWPRAGAEGVDQAHDATGSLMAGETDASREGDPVDLRRLWNGGGSAKAGAEQRLQPPRSRCISDASTACPTDRSNRSSSSL